MQICEEVAGFTPEEADKFRKACCGQRVRVQKELHEKFIEGGLKNGHEREELESVWEFIVDWRTFNKSHAVSYTMIAYWMAYFKANYPEEFFVALLNNNMDLKDEVERYMQDGRDHRVFILPPDRTESGLFELLEMD